MGFKIEAGELVLSNGLFVRKIELPEKRGKYYLQEYRPLKGEFPFIGQDGEEFSFALNGVIYSGSTGWQMKSLKEVSGLEHGEGVTVVLEALTTSLKVEITYIWYPCLLYTSPSPRDCS